MMALFVLVIAAGSHAATLDLSKAMVVSAPDSSGPERKAVAMLVDEVAARAQIRWPVETSWPASDQPVIAVGPIKSAGQRAGRFAVEFSSRQTPGPAEGFRIDIKTDKGAPAVFVLGNDSRGVLFGVGQLLRSLRMNSGSITLPADFKIASAPRYQLRGHQLGYRPKTHSYDAWDLKIWEQYIRDLAIFGCNAVELIPPRSDDAETSPHFPLPPLEMLRGMSRLLDDYGLDVWLWYPALDKDYSDPRTVEFALREWGEVFKQLPRLDAVFVPGGDPGHTRPKVLMALLEKQTQVLRRFHPAAQMWVSPQGFNQEWLDEFLAILSREQPAWLSGVVFGPQVRLSLPQLRAAVPKKYPLRHYPDITHCRQCQYPVPDWDTAFAVTEGREGVNPRPTQMATIFRLLQPHTIGFISYSEGCNDDVNKAVWSALGWDPEANVIDILRDYSRYFIGERYTENFAQGLLALEKNWQGPLLANETVDTTLQQFQAMERAASPRDKLNWRFQEALYRAYYDAYTRNRLLYETGLEDQAMEVLRDARARSSLLALDQAQAILDGAVTRRVSADWRARVFELGEALFQSIRMQLSVEKYQAIAVDRGANLDTIDYPLNNRRWLKHRFEQLRKAGSEAERLKGIDEILRWTDPGPGGFYDDLGDVSRQVHLVAGAGFTRDPAFLESPHAGFEEGDDVDEPDEKPASPLRYSWLNHAESMHDAPLQLRYTHLDANAQYKVRVVYGGDSPKKKIRLTAGDGLEVHPLMPKPWPVQPIEFDITAKATAGGELTLTWQREPGLGGNGRGCQVSEVWLIKTSDF
jgi:hypothetical protein